MKASEWVRVQRFGDRCRGYPRLLANGAAQRQEVSRCVRARPLLPAASRLRATGTTLPARWLFRQREAPPAVPARDRRVGPPRGGDAVRRLFVGQLVETVKAFDR